VYPSHISAQSQGKENTKALFVVRAFTTFTVRPFGFASLFEVSYPNSEADEQRSARITNNAFALKKGAEAPLSKQPGVERRATH